MNILLILLISFYSIVVAILYGNTIKVIYKGKETKVRIKLRSRITIWHLPIPINLPIELMI